MPKSENDNYHLGQLNRPVSQIDIQRNMVGFVVDGHILMTFTTYTISTMQLLRAWSSFHIIIVTYIE